MFLQQQRQPATGPGGGLYLTAMGGENGWSVFRVDQANGAVIWQRSPYPANGMSPPVSDRTDPSTSRGASATSTRSRLPGNRAGRLRRCDHRPSSGDPRWGRGRCRCSARLRTARNGPRLKHGDGQPGMADQPARRERRQPDPVHPAPVLGQQRHRLLRYRHPRRHGRPLVPVCRRNGNRQQPATSALRRATRRRQATRPGAHGDRRRRMLGRNDHAHPLATGQDRARSEPRSEHDDAARRAREPDGRPQVAPTPITARRGPGARVERRCRPLRDESPRRPRGWPRSRLLPAGCGGRRREGRQLTSGIRCRATARSITLMSARRPTARTPRSSRPANDAVSPVCSFTASSSRRHSPAGGPATSG